MVTRPAASRRLATAAASRHSGLSTTAPRLLCRSESATRQRSSRQTMPLRPRKSCGVPSAVMLPNSHQQPSARNSAACCATKSPRLGLPTSSSPSMIQRTLSGSAPPCLAFTARMAARRETNSPLSSLMPRP